MNNLLEKGIIGLIAGVLMGLGFAIFYKKAKKEENSNVRLAKMLGISPRAKFKEIKMARDEKLSNPKIKKEIKEEIEKLFMEIMR